MSKNINGLIPFRSLDTQERQALDELIINANSIAEETLDSSITRNGRTITLRANAGSELAPYVVKYASIGLTNIADPLNPAEGVSPVWSFVNNNGEIKVAVTALNLVDALING
jgi:hypothetical protein